MAAVAITLTIETDVLAVRAEVTVPAGDDRLSLARVGPSGVKTFVRGYDAATVAAGVVVIRDFEAPVGVPLHYTATTWNATTPGTTNVGSASITVPIADDCADTWLTDLVRPTNTQQIVIQALPELAYAVPVGVHDILGRRTPIVSGDVANTPTFELAFLTDSDDSREKARATLGNGVPVLLRSTPATGIGSLYFAVTGFSEQRVVPDGLVPDRRFVVAAVQVDRPDPGLYDPIPPATYDAVGQTFATYAALLAGRSSYDALLYHYAGGEASDVVPWPPVDV